MEYPKKRQDLLWSGVNVMEIDPTRRGDRRGLLWPDTLKEMYHTTYCAITRRPAWPSRFEVYPITLRQRLPILPIPLRENDDDLPLDLQPLLDLAYANGRFDRTDYAQPLEPPLEGDDAAWAEALLTSEPTT